MGQDVWAAVEGDAWGSNAGSHPWGSGRKAIHTCHFPARYYALCTSFPHLTPSIPQMTELTHVTICQGSGYLSVVAALPRARSLGKVQPREKDKKDVVLFQVVRGLNHRQHEDTSLQFMGVNKTICWTRDHREARPPFQHNTTRWVWPRKESSAQGWCLCGFLTVLPRLSPSCPQSKDKNTP